VNKFHNTKCTGDGGQILEFFAFYLFSRLCC